MSASDDEPSLDRVVGKHANKSQTSSSDDDLPDWVKEHQSPFKKKEEKHTSEDSDAVDLTLTQDKQAEGGTSQKQKGWQAPVPSTEHTADPQHQVDRAVTLEKTIAQDVGIKSEVIIVLPDKIVRNKVLVELQSSEDTENVTDLSGDAGAVGRFIISGGPGSEEVKLDLKGVLYAASILPLAGTAMVLNIGPTEAKVETLVNDFVRLKEDMAAADSGADDAYVDLYDDDDNYQLEGVNVDGAEEDGKKAKGKATQKLKKDGAKKASVHRKPKAPGPKGGVSKKAGKGAAGGKGKGGAKKHK